MTKEQMIKEIIGDLNYGHREQEVIHNRCSQPKALIQNVYRYFQKSKKTTQDRVFCLNLLIKW